MQNYKQISDKALSHGLKSLEKSFGKSFAEKGLADSEYKSIPTGYDELDSILTKGHGGLFLGGLCEFSGSNSSGKTSLAMRIVGNAQKLGLKCMWVDAEHSFSPDLAEINRCDTSDLVFLNLTEGENENIHILGANEILNRVFQAAWSNIFSVIVIDSVASLMSDRVATTEIELGNKQPGELPRILAEHLPRLATACEEKECTVILINQIRSTLDPYSPTDTPGGKALKHYCSQRIFIEKIGGKSGLIVQKDEDEREEVVGHYARIKIAKNRRNRPYFDNLEIPIYYKEYFPDNAKKVYDLARRLQVITVRTGVMTWKEENNIIGQHSGESEFLAFLRTEGSNYVERLANACVLAADNPKNKEKKAPVKVPSQISRLADKYREDVVSSQEIDKELLKPTKVKKHADEKQEAV